jgi:pimeloyl-ACP methyl ester carboxylesterase
MSYWRHVVPLLTPHYTVIAVDNRAPAAPSAPLTGYDTATMAGDVAELEPFYCPELQLIAKHNLVSHQPYYRRGYQYAWQKGNG